jgi:hypothetical protein
MIRGIKRPKLKKITVLAAFALWQDRGSGQARAQAAERATHEIEVMSH